MTARIVLFAQLILVIGLALAQQSHRVFVKHGSILILPDTIITAEKDTVVQVPQDVPYQIKDLSEIKSQSFYDSLGIKTRNNRLTNLLFRSLLVSSSSAMEDSIDFLQSESPFLPYEGKVIGRIRIKKVQVLAGSVLDTLEIVESSVSKFLNNLHYPTRDGVLRNNLLFEVGEVVDPFVLADNERILRELPYIEDARIEVVISEDDENLVDIIVITKDLFSLGISPSVLDLDRARVAFFDRNLLGLGTELRYTLHYDKREEPKFGHEGKYVMTNIEGTFISGLLNYKNSFEGIFSRIFFQRIFLTPQIRYAGALDLGYFITTREEFLEDTVIVNSYSTDYQDFWLGRSFLIGQDHSRKNLIISGRVRKDNFRRRPRVTADLNRFYQNNQYFLASLTFREINYYKSSMILAFGITEDIPVGYLLQITGGYEREEFARKPYFGIALRRAALWQRIGYLGATLDFGSFLNQGKLNEGVIAASVVYFTPLNHINNYRFRQILLVDWTSGINRLPGENIGLGDYIRGLDGGAFVGANRFTLKAESIAFAPWNLYGFRFALFSYGDVGFLGGNARLFTWDNIFGSFGIGCRIRNESLVLKTVQIRFGYFLRTPDRFGAWQIDINTRDPSLFVPIDRAKPSLIGYE